MNVVYSAIAVSKVGLLGRLEVVISAVEMVRNDSWKQLLNVAQKWHWFVIP